MAAPPLEWYSRYYATFGVWHAISPDGSEVGDYPGHIYTGRSLVEGTTYVWTIAWQTTNDASVPNIVFPNGPDPSDIAAGNIGWAAGITAADAAYGEGYGELRLYCSVDGTPVPGYLWMAWTPNPAPFNYADRAWGYDGTTPEVPPFWTGFMNTVEVP